MYNGSRDSGGGGCLKFCPDHAKRTTAAAVLLLLFLLAAGAAAQTPAELSPAGPGNTSASTEAPVTVDASPATDDKDRIFGVIPNYLTVENPSRNVAPLTVKEKFRLFAKETIDPFTVLSAAAGAALSQVDNQNPKYGEGAGPYAERFGAAVADITTQNFFQDAVFASLLHEDPRYFRKGPEFGVWYRVGYALSRVVVTRTDAGKDRFNFSGILGMSAGIALSNAYYPGSSVNAGEVGYRFATSAVSSALSNLLPEFWPDIHEKFFHRKPHTSPSLP
jgi:hypothetical protein